MFAKTEEGVEEGGSAIFEEKKPRNFTKIQVNLPTHTMDSLFDMDYTPEASWPPAPLTTDEHGRPVSRGRNAQLKLGKTEKYKRGLGLGAGDSKTSQSNREPMPVSVQEFGFRTESRALEVVEKYKKKLLYGTVLKAREKALDIIFEKKNKSLENKLKMRPKHYSDKLKEMDILNGYASPLKVKPIETKTRNIVKNVSRLSLLDQKNTSNLRKKRATKSLPIIKTSVSKKTIQQSLNFTFIIGDIDDKNAEKSPQVDKRKLENMSSSLILKEFSDQASATLKDWTYPHKVLRPTSAPSSRPNSTPTIVNGMYQGSETLKTDVNLEKKVSKRPASADTFLARKTQPIELSDLSAQLPKKTNSKKMGMKKTLSTPPPKISVPNSPNSSQSGLLYSNPSEMRVSSPSRGNKRRKMRKTTSKRSVIITSDRDKSAVGGFTPENSVAELVPWETSEDNLLNAAIAISRERSTAELKKKNSANKINPVFKLAEDKNSLMLETESNLTLTVTHAVPHISRSTEVSRLPRKRPGKIYTGVVKHKANVQMQLASVDKNPNNSEDRTSADSGRKFRPHFKINAVNKKKTLSLKTIEEKAAEVSRNKEKQKEIFVESDCFDKKVPPSGWERHYDSKGNSFYFHKKSLTSQRVYPTKHEVQNAIKKSKRMEAEAKSEQPIKRRKKVQRSKKGNRLIERLNATVWEQRER